jgi:1-acyl-sn-glycerol-3-phosphate acyltransferase
MGKHHLEATHLPFSPRTLSVSAKQQGLVYTALNQLNTWVCRLMYGVKSSAELPVPSEGPALIVCDHTSLGDPLLMLATAGRPVRFLMAEEIYSQRHIRWAFQAFRCIPVQRGKRDIRAIRTMLDGLATQEVNGLFPEGGLDRHRLEEGHPGIAYLAIKSGAPVIPASIIWEGPHSVTSMVKTICVPSKATIRYGKPLQFPQESSPSKDSMQSCTKEVMARIEELRKSMLSGVS